MKRMLRGIAVLMGLISLIGCQKTPENPIVVGKDFAQMINQALLGQPTDASILEQVGATETYVLD